MRLVIGDETGRFGLSHADLGAQHDPGQAHAGHRSSKRAQPRPFGVNVVIEPSASSKSMDVT